MFVELTLADGRKTAVPKVGMKLVEALAPGAFEKFPEAKTFVLFQIEHVVAHAFVRDSFVQVMRLFPMAEGGAKWLDFKKEDGLELAVKDGSIIGWTQKKIDDDTLFQIKVRARMEELDTYDVVSNFKDIRAVTQTEIEEVKPKKAKVDDL